MTGRDEAKENDYFLYEAVGDRQMETGHEPHGHLVQLVDPWRRDVSKDGSRRCVARQNRQSAFQARWHRGDATGTAPNERESSSVRRGLGLVLDSRMRLEGGGV